MKAYTKFKIIAIMIGILLAIDIVLCIAFPADAEDIQPNAWILRRQTTDNVVIQKKPGSQPYEYWRQVDNDPACGSALYLTGETHGKWLKCICLYLPEAPEGWIHEGFVVYDEPHPCGMVATVTRKVTAKESIGGRDAWECMVGDRVKVLYSSGEWSTTIWGFVPTDALDFTRTGSVTQPRRIWPDWTRLDHLINIIDRW